MNQPGGHSTLSVRIRLLAGMLTLAIVLLAGCQPAMTPLPVSQEKIRTPEQKTGIKIIGVRHASAGYMLDFRYTVEEPIRARIMFDRATIPYLIHEATGARFMVPNPAKVGPLRATTREPEAGKIYYIFFANPGRYVKAGDLVTVVMGKRRFEHMVVQ